MEGNKWVVVMSAILLFSILSFRKHHMPRLSISKNHHSLVKENGEPFFWLGDTGWGLFQNLNRDEARKYLKDRRDKQFTVIQTHILTWNISDTNAYGNAPFIDNNFDNPNELYWKHADEIVQMSEEYGLYMALLPAWAATYTEVKKSKDGESSNVLPLSNDTVQAYQYAKFLGNRYKKFDNIIWILGGDVWGRNDAIYDNLAKGLTETYGKGNADDILISFHPQGGTYRPPATSSSEFYGNKPWLDFNMIQSGHSLGNKNYERIIKDYYLHPAKPVLESEPCYEEHPVQHDFKKGKFNAWHVRRRAYWSLLAGGCGFSYGANGIWQMDKPGKIFKQTHFNNYWPDALNYEGAKQMKFVRTLFESRPRGCIPDSTLIISARGEVDDRIQCARGENNEYAFVYSTNGNNFTLDLSRISGKKLNAYWYSPRDGKLYSDKNEVINRAWQVFEKKGIFEFNPPGDIAENNDWVLVIDNSSKKN